MIFLKEHTIAISALCVAIFSACGTPPKKAETIDYGTAGIGLINSEQTRALMNCYLAGDTAAKIIELRSEGKSDDDIIKHYAATIDKSWLGLVYDLVPVVAKDNPDAGGRIDYARNLYTRCLGTMFEPRASQIATFCFQTNQLVQLAFVFRDANQPMETVYTKMPADGKARVISDALLARAKKIDQSQEGNFRLATYYGCLGHPEKAPVRK